MAERREQATTAERLSAQESDLKLTLVLFFAGTLRLGVEARQIRTSRTVSARHSPDEKSIETLLGLSPAADWSSRQVLCIKAQGSGQVCDQSVQVGGPIELQEINADAIHPLPTLLAARTQWPHLRGLAHTSAGVIPLVDLQTLIQG